MFCHHSNQKHSKWTIASKYQQIHVTVNCFVECTLGLLPNHSWLLQKDAKLDGFIERVRFKARIKYSEKVRN